MFYLIEFDTREVIFTHEQRDPLIKFISDNNLEAQFTLIDCKDDLLLEFSLRELSDMYEVLKGSRLPSPIEQTLVDEIWDLLEFEDLPTYTDKAGKALLKAASKSDGKPVKNTSKSDKPKTDKPKVVRNRKAKLDGNVFTVGDTPPMKGRHADMVQFVTDNFEEATYEELCSFLESHKGRPDEHIGFAVRKGFLKVINED